MLILLENNKTFFLNTNCDRGSPVKSAILLKTEIEKVESVKDLADTKRLSLAYLALSALCSQEGFDILSKHYLNLAIKTSPNITKSEISKTLESDKDLAELYLFLCDKHPELIEWGK